MNQGNIKDRGKDEISLSARRGNGYGDELRLRGQHHQLLVHKLFDT